MKQTFCGTGKFATNSFSSSLSSSSMIPYQPLGRRDCERTGVCFFPIGEKKITSSSSSSLLSSSSVIPYHPLGWRNCETGVCFFPIGEKKVTSSSLWGVGVGCFFAGEYLSSSSSKLSGIPYHPLCHWTGLFSFFGWRVVVEVLVEAEDCKGLEERDWTVFEGREG